MRVVVIPRMGHHTVDPGGVRRRHAPSPAPDGRLRRATPFAHQIEHLARTRRVAARRGARKSVEQIEPDGGECCGGKPIKGETCGKGRELGCEIHMLDGWFHMVEAHIGFSVHGLCPPLGTFPVWQRVSR